MKSKYTVTTKKLKAHQKWLKGYLLRGYGPKCGHISQDKISLDCVVCTHWLANVRRNRMKLHICTKTPCPVEDKEIFDRLNNSCETTFTATETNWEKEIYRIIDSFLVEAKNQVGNDRSLEQLNQDRHLAADKFLQLLFSERQRLRGEIAKLYWCEEHKIECDHKCVGLDDILKLLEDE